MVNLLLSVYVVALAVSDGLPVNTPKSVGMSAARLGSIDRIVRRGITAGGYPGASVVIGRRGYAVFQKGFGKLGWTSSSNSVTADRTIYDLASLTKTLASTLLMQLYEAGKLNLDEPMVRYVPEFGDDVTIRHVLSHTSVS